ncbi:hypothetical protein E2C01_043060 [Portunus trituberculatus]|uniref:Uncharacterized protein n=1 Tax=Portunus trituberculatus TaxID=210409 RepID=A0A5B7FRW8_PORTR|nr:hypothetical protein [Portunus trituberculatus]
MYLILTRERSNIYTIWEETTRSWGRLENGSSMFTGMMGQLQREDVDFGTISGPTPERIAVMDHVIINSRPRYVWVRAGIASLVRIIRVNMAEAVGQRRRHLRSFCDRRDVLAELSDSELIKGIS